MKMGRHPHNALTVAKVRTVKEPVKGGVKTYQRGGAKLYH